MQGQLVKAFIRRWAALDGLLLFEVVVGLLPFAYGDAWRIMYRTLCTECEV